MIRALVRAGYSAFFAPTSPRSLAVFRISVFAVALLDIDVHRAPHLAALPAELRVAPVGLAWLGPHVSTGVTATWAIYGLYLSACALALIGLRTRSAATTALLTGLYLLGLPQFQGAVVHYHHLVWFMALLAASPCGDALSVDAWWRARNGATSPPPSTAYAVPLRIGWVLVGLIYFFPGYWKWRSAGLSWALGDNLIHQMHWKWLQLGGFRPFFRLDRHPSLCHAAALAVLVFEVSFLFLVGFRRVRPLLAGGAILFHIATDLFMGIRFTGLWLCYTMFFDWSSRRSPPSAIAPAWRSSIGALVVGAGLVTGNLWYGFHGITAGWPLACYPTFHTLAGDEMPSLRVDLVDEAGQTRALDDRALAHRLGPTRSWGMKWSLASRPGDEALRRYLRLLTPDGAGLDGATEARFYRVWLPVDPDAPPVPRRTELLSVVSLPLR